MTYQLSTWTKVDHHQTESLAVRENKQPTNQTKKKQNRGRYQSKEYVSNKNLTGTNSASSNEHFSK